MPARPQPGPEMPARPQPGPQMPALPGPGAWPARPARSRCPAARRHLVILGGYLAAGVASAWPRASYLAHHRLPATRDAAAYVWCFWWVAQQLGHVSSLWFTRYLAAPVGTQLGLHVLMPLGGGDGPHHRRLRPICLLQPAVGGGARAAVLRGVPGGQPVAALASGGGTGRLAR